jgi:L,D-peptidoglycan transpeptidase YkuD (ErfK/YbiS/YcfS/YnhG family)
MDVGRTLSSCAAAVAVAGCAFVAVGMSRASTVPDASGTAVSVTAPAPATGYHRPAALLAVPTPSAPAAASTGATSPPVDVTRTVAAPPPPPRTTPPPPAPVPPPAPAPPQRGGSLPLSFATGTATRVITVVAASTGSTTATLQAWDKAPGGGWLAHGGAVTAHVGADGLSSSPSESRSATPIGSFSLTQAFGYYANPGTGLPYFQTTPDDWWISQAGPLYNTHQRCAGPCSFTRGDPNEHLYFETPAYDYAVVIDYNTPNAGAVRQGAGSAFFLHVTNGQPTAGCVAIPPQTLVALMQWLTPAAAPRILIGVA